MQGSTPAESTVEIKLNYYVGKIKVIVTQIHNNDKKNFGTMFFFYESCYYPFFFSTVL